MARVIPDADRPWLNSARPTLVRLIATVDERRQGGLPRAETHPRPVSEGLLGNSSTSKFERELAVLRTKGRGATVP